MRCQKNNLAKKVTIGLVAQTDKQKDKTDNLTLRLQNKLPPA